MLLKQQYIYTITLKLIDKTLHQSIKYLMYLITITSTGNLLTIKSTTCDGDYCLSSTDDNVMPLLNLNAKIFRVCIPSERVVSYLFISVFPIIRKCRTYVNSSA